MITRRQTLKAFGLGILATALAPVQSIAKAIKLNRRGEETLTDVIFNISPEPTPFMKTITKAQADVIKRRTGEMRKDIEKALKFAH